MQRRTTTKALTTAVVLVACGTTVLGTGGCYKRVVNARGIGADSSKLRSEYEREPVHYRTNSESRRESREVRSAREREK